MVQVLPHGEDVAGPGFGGTFMRTLTQQTPGVLENLIEGVDRGREDEAIQRLTGQDVRGLKDPKMREGFLKNRAEAQLYNDPKTLATLEGAFGPKFVDLYKSVPTGAKTELIKNAMAATDRGIDIEQKLNRSGKSQNNAQGAAQQQGAPQGQAQKFEFPPMPLPEGMNSKEQVDYKNQLRKENLPIFQELQGKIRSGQEELSSIKTLKNLSPHLPKNLGRLIINPETGEPYAVAQLLGGVNKQTQQWTKTINQFVDRARDVYGSRVTNFDVQNFLKRLPGLLNTEEGREVILNQMEIVDKLRLSHMNAMKKIYTNYGNEGISYERAVQLADSMVEQEEAGLYSQLDALSKEGDTVSMKGRVKVVSPDGKSGTISENQLQDALSKGYKQVQ